MSTGIAQVEFAVEVQYLLDNWKRTALANFSQGVTVTDPGHGFDEICPVSVVGIPFDPDKDSDVAPFVAQDIKDIDGQDGVGFLAVELRPRGQAVVITPGVSPEMREDHWIDILIATPSRNGPALAYAYTGALAMIFRRLTLTPGESGIDIIRNLIAPPERPQPEGDDGIWRWDRMVIQMSRFYRSPSAVPNPAFFDTDFFEDDFFETT